MAVNLAASWRYSRGRRLAWRRQRGRRRSRTKIAYALRVRFALTNFLATFGTARDGTREVVAATRRDGEDTLRADLAELSTQSTHDLAHVLLVRVLRLKRQIARELLRGDAALHRRRRIRFLDRACAQRAQQLELER